MLLSGITPGSGKQMNLLNPRPLPEDFYGPIPIIEFKTEIHGILIYEEDSIPQIEEFRPSHPDSRRYIQLSVLLIDRYLFPENLMAVRTGNRIH